MITAVIPAYNEEDRIEKVLEETPEYVGEILVIDDNSTDNTAQVAQSYATVLRNSSNLGYIGSIKKGFAEAEGDIIVTLDADGEHNPSHIPRITAPIEEGKADLVFGRREKIPRPSERFLSRLTRFKVNVKDSGIGFRAIKTDLAKKLKLKGYCTCGSFALEAFSKGAKITEVPTPTRDIEKPKSIAWQHFFQFFVVLKWLLIN